MDPIGIEPTTSTLPVSASTIVSPDENRNEIVPPALVPPNMPPNNLEPCALLDELLSICERLDAAERAELLVMVRTAFDGDAAEND